MHRAQPSWEDLARRYDAAVGLARKYDLDPSAPERERMVFSQYRAAVLLLGPENSGKSALLAALTGCRLLPVGITPEWTVPTELRFGGAAPALCGGEKTVRLDPQALSGRRFSQPGTHVRLFADCPLLRELERLRLVEMPGLCDIDLSALRPERFGAQSFACLLVFAADDPVVSARTAAALDRLRLFGAPVRVLMTKCDKVTPGELSAARDYLRRELDGLLGFPLEVGCVCTRPEADVSAAREALRELERSAQTGGLLYYQERLRRHAQPTAAYLRARLAAADSSAAPGTRQTDPAKQLEERYAAAARRAAERLEELDGGLPGRLGGLLRESSGVFETVYRRKITGGQEVRELLRLLLTSVIVNDYEPVFTEWETALGLPPTQQDLLSAGDEKTLGGYTPAITRMGPIAPERVPCARTALSAALEQLGRTDYDVARLIEACRPKRRLRGAKLTAAVGQSLLPPLGEILAGCVHSGLRIRQKRLRKRAETALAGQRAALERAEADRREQVAQKKRERERQLDEMRRDLRELQNLIDKGEGGEGA